MDLEVRAHTTRKGSEKSRRSYSKEMLISIVRVAWRQVLSNQSCWREIEFESNVKLNVYPSFAIWATHLVLEELWSRQLELECRCAWAKFKEISPILTALSASYHIKGKIYRDQSVLTCGIETWPYGTETWVWWLKICISLERAKCMMVRWMCGVSLKNRKRSENLNSLLGIHSVADVVEAWQIEMVWASGA